MLWAKIYQYKEFSSVSFCFLFSLFSLFWNGNFLVRGVVNTARIGDTVSSSIDSLGDVFKSTYNKIESFETVRKERDFYKKLADEYKLLPHDLEKLKNENESLRRELKFSPLVQHPWVKAEVVSVRLNSIYRTILLDKGSDAGIKPYMPVVARALDDKGEVISSIVGKIVAVSSSSSVIQPLINSNFYMGVEIPGTNLWANLSGNSGRGTDAVLNFIDSGIIIDPRTFSSFQMGPSLPQGKEGSDLNSFSKIGKSVYTSGGSGIFPPGIPVGTIIEEGPRNGYFKTAYLRPFVKFEELKYVTVILKAPDKWALSWPEEKNISIENSIFGELNFPDETKEEKQKTTKDMNAPQVKNDKKKQESTSVPKPSEENESTEEENLKIPPVTE
ncbi:MAG: rod shape-determining protein MreC [Leptospiraceae bacterium]|nr:rod shape-determining protein MreC [Leptospiraceae bacterium]MCK6381781.1 rod shape-determining protein MreC [Leptospiraceae bacterium]NUM40623.1 rod shape-determining protein MreC [Leptospiraceae bacterium]